MNVCFFWVEDNCDDVIFLIVVVVKFDMLIWVDLIFMGEEVLKYLDVICDMFCDWLDLILFDLNFFG